MSKFPKNTGLVDPYAARSAIEKLDKKREKRTQAQRKEHVRLRRKSKLSKTKYAKDNSIGYATFLFRVKDFTS